MTVNTYVYSHPINVFIIKHLGIPVEQFCSLYGYSQGTLSSWVTRKKKIDTLPARFIYDLSLATSLSMDNVYSILFDLEKEYLAFKEAAGTKVKKRID
jgi:hypothetical protein